MLDPIRKIIVPTDFSELSDAALRTAARLAVEDDASIHLLHSIRLPFLHTNYDVNIPEAVWEGIRKGTRERMYDGQLMLEEAGISEVGLIVSESRQPAEAIAQSAEELDADLVVMATHGRRGLKHAVLGSITERTLRTSPIPVLAVKNTRLGETPIRRILLPTDFSKHSDEALSLACSLAKRHNAHLDLLHVLDCTPDYLRFGSAAAIEFDQQVRVFAAEQLSELGGKIRARDISTTTHFQIGTAASIIAEEAAKLNSDLIVMGTHGLTGFAHAVIGSVTERTLQLAPCSVLTTKAPKTSSTANE